jgi:hypothetical protein
MFTSSLLFGTKVAAAARSVAFIAREKLRG